MKNKKILLGKFLEYKEDNHIIIPILQRDYTLGSQLPTKENLNKATLKGFLDFLVTSYEKLERIESNSNNKVGSVEISSMVFSSSGEIYDGQQRYITISLILALLMGKPLNFKYKLEMKNEFLEVIQKQISKVHDHIIEGSLKKIIEELNEKCRKFVIDYNSESLLNGSISIIEYFSKREIDYNSFCRFLVNNIYINYIEVDKETNEAQLFREINSGLSLTDYEIYKSKLINKLSSLEGSKESILMISAIDNKWLDLTMKNVCNKVANEENLIKAEIYLIEYLILAFSSLVIDKNVDLGEVDYITSDHVKLVYYFMDKNYEIVTKLKGKKNKMTDFYRLGRYNILDDYNGLKWTIFKDSISYSDLINTIKNNKCNLLSTILKINIENVDVKIKIRNLISYLNNNLYSVKPHMTIHRSTDKILSLAFFENITGEEWKELYGEKCSLEGNDIEFVKTMFYEVLCLANNNNLDDKYDKSDIPEVIRLLPGIDNAELIDLSINQIYYLKNFIESKQYDKNLNIFKLIEDLEIPYLYRGDIIYNNMMGNRHAIYGVIGITELGTILSKNEKLNLIYENPSSIKEKVEAKDMVQVFSYLAFDYQISDIISPKVLSGGKIFSNTDKYSVDASQVYIEKYK